MVGAVVTSLRNLFLNLINLCEEEHFFQHQAKLFIALFHASLLRFAP